jgi:hypothetical protein
MKFNRYLTEQNDGPSLKRDLIEFFKVNPTPTDDEVHKFAEDNGVEPDAIETIIYALLGSFFGSGRSKDFTGKYDPEQLKLGIEIEMEHTNDKDIAERIAKDHLAEFTDYYSRLITMEKEAEGE